LDGVLVPIPQYPLYSALLALQGATLVKYFLDEGKNWGVDSDEMESRIKSAKDLGIRPRAITVINPGNPTGQVLSRADIEKIILLAYKHRMVILADEVYQDNIYTQNAPFISIRKVLAEMGNPFSNSVELISMHSTSKGLMGECGLRGGYMETVNLDPYVEKILYKLKSIELCSNTVGQLATYLMVTPPKAGQESDECVQLYEKER
jgi:aspartate/methionine/tyrosine aminotransferase